MKTKKIKLLGAALAACVSSAAFANIGTWISVENVVPDPGSASYAAADITMTWGIFGPNVPNVVSTLKGLPHGAWQVYHKNLDNDVSKTDIHPNGDTSKMLLFAGTENAQLFTQAYTSFGLSQEVLNADKAKISFDLGYVGNTDTSVNIKISGSGWEVIEVKPEFRVGAQAEYMPGASFAFGLINLATEEIYAANIDSAEFMFDFNTDEWFTFNVDENGTISVSFELDASQLAAITDAGLGLFIRSSKTGKAEIYEIGNFRTEIMMIPEASYFAGIIGIVSLAAVFFRKRR